MPSHLPFQLQTNIVKGHPWAAVLNKTRRGKKERGVGRLEAVFGSSAICSAFFRWMPRSFRVIGRAENSLLRVKMASTSNLMPSFDWISG